MTDEQLAMVAKALGHPARIHIVRLLAGQTECRGHDLFTEVPLAQSTVSEHLRILKEAGLVDSHPVGTAMVYCLRGAALDEFRGALVGIAATAVDCSMTQDPC
jgi:ArsR family transcriptional regulator